MSRNNALFFILLIITLVIVTASCRKKALETTFSRIQGKWKLASYAFDDNGDGKIETNEIHAQPSDNSDILQFKGDSTGVEYTSSELSFAWLITYSDSLRIEYYAHDTITYYISLINSDNLTLVSLSTTDSGAQLLTEKYYNKD